MKKTPTPNIASPDRSPNPSRTPSVSPLDGGSSSNAPAIGQPLPQDRGNSASGTSDQRNTGGK